MEETNEADMTTLDYTWQIRQETSSVSLRLKCIADTLVSEAIKSLVSYESEIIERAKGYGLTNKEMTNITNGLDAMSHDILHEIHDVVCKHVDDFMHDDYGDALHRLQGYAEEREEDDLRNSGGMSDADSVQMDYNNAIRIV
jgi:hypothetical protein